MWFNSESYQENISVQTVEWAFKSHWKYAVLLFVIQALLYFIKSWIYFEKFDDEIIVTGQRGASIVSFFLFVRWLLLMNIIILLLNLFFLVLPNAFSHEMKYHHHKKFTERSILLKSETEMGIINNYAVRIFKFLTCLRIWNLLNYCTIFLFYSY